MPASPSSAGVEKGMGELRAAIADGEPAAEVQRRGAAIDRPVRRGRAALRPRPSSGASAFVGALAILLREGLEALLIVVAMIGLPVGKADRSDMLRWVHIGWIGALGRRLRDLVGGDQPSSRISGAGRELTEGFGSLLAAAVLLFVGIWMHGKAQAGAWQAYVRRSSTRR